MKAPHIGPAGGRAPQATARRQEMLERAAVLIFPRRCPFCGALLGTDAVMAAVCPACRAAEQRLAHTPPRLPQTEHSFAGISGAVGAYYYAGEVRHAILLCKSYGHPWYARELADLALVRVYGARPAIRPGDRPFYQNLTGLPLYSGIVPVPPRSRGHGRGISLPMLLARRLGQVLQLPVLDVLYTTRPLAEQKTLEREARLRNVRGAYAVRAGVDLSGQRLLLVDDVITTGATISACALALQQAAAAEVFAFCLAADEELPKEKRTELSRKKQGSSRAGRSRPLPPKQGKKV